ncbi:hypothetical protein [Enterovirga sp. CN4-39]|uniref:hypothetical protein n=1 Tax=Enterovirga sp. CN4-39 TaxID=3400910 RepID=UPI003C10B47C
MGEPETEDFRDYTLPGDEVERLSDFLLLELGEMYPLQGRAARAWADELATRILRSFVPQSRKTESCNLKSETAIGGITLYSHWPSLLDLRIEPEERAK